MELKTILAIGLVVFIVGALIFLKIRAKKKLRPGAAQPPSLHIPKKYIRRIRLWFIFSVQT